MSLPWVEFNLGPYQILARCLRLSTLKIRVDMLSWAYDQDVDEFIYGQIPGWSEMKLIPPSKINRHLVEQSHCRRRFDERRV